jgi:hypothetical protein
MVQKQQEHQQDLAIEANKAKLKATVDADLARQKVDHDLVAEARKQELTSHYDGERARQSLDHEDRRESLKQRSESQREAQKQKPEREAAVSIEKRLDAMAKAIEQLAAAVKGKPAQRRPAR